MWWEQISEYIDLKYQKKLEELIEQGTDSMDPHTTYHIKGDAIWALGPKTKHEIMRGQWGKELKDISLQELLKLFKKSFLPTRNVFHSKAQFFNIRQEDGETLDEYWEKIGRYRKEMRIQHYYTRRYYHLQIRSIHQRQESP